MNTQHASFDLLHAEGATTPIKGWTHGVPVEDQARQQLRNITTLPFVGPWVAVMPDVHLGIGATVGSVVPTKGAIIPAAVGVDIGCGMAAVRTTLRADDLPDDLSLLRNSIERSVPVGNGPGGEHRRIPDSVETALLLGVGVKDVILPGEMKEILNSVVQAEKSAQANVIRRREEANATRSLLNTAKLVEESPVLMRLKELEALEKVTEKIDKLTVFGGLDGVMKQLVSLKQ